MKFIGIDLGTTNSAICSFDGEAVHLYKSPEQHDVTPSAIFIDRRGNKYIGSRAYVNAARNPDNSATLFKRFMGTSTPIPLSAVNLTLSPEECSAEILKTLFGYLPEEIRGDGDTGTVITVPAAFNQMQKEATLEAAEAAGLGNVALMQEPVAAVMSVMRQRRGDGIFLVYDLGGGTLDIAIAQSISGRVSLLAHGGVAMFGGRDFDRTLFDNVVKPWLLNNFDLPENIVSEPKYKPLIRMATYAAERAKIELSQRDEVTISFPETELGVRDESGNEIYVDITLTRDRYNTLISSKIEESIIATRETIEKAQLSPHDIERIVFVGGPVHYKPLRDKVSFELGIAPSTEVNPMTAVAEGAAVFAESIDWNSQSRGRKSSTGAIKAGGILDLSFNYIARTTDPKSRVIAKSLGLIPKGAEFQIDSLDTGWTSGRIPLKEGAATDVPLSKPGDNSFKIFVFDTNGAKLDLKSDRIVIARTSATIDGIPASHSVGLEVLTKIGGRPKLFNLIKDGDQLPKRGKEIFKSSETLKAGSNSSINFKVWEGNIDDPIVDNRFIGLFKIKGRDFDDGVIPAGADLIVEYEMLDSGCLVLEVEIPSIGASFPSQRNFYSSQEGKIDYTQQTKKIHDESDKAKQRINEIAPLIDDERLTRARNLLEQADQVRVGEVDPEASKKAMDNIQEAKRLLDLARRDHSKTIRQLDLDKAVELFNQIAREEARSSEQTSFDNLVRTAQRSIDDNRDDFSSLLDELRSRTFSIVWRQDGFVIARFKWLSDDLHLFPDQNAHQQLVMAGQEALRNNDMDQLRLIVQKMDVTKIGTPDEEDMVAATNIIRR